MTIIIKIILAIITIMIGSTNYKKTKIKMKTIFSTDYNRKS